MLFAREIIEQARRTVDRIPINGEMTARPSDVSESPSRTISDDSFLGWIASEEKKIVSNCKALHALRAIYQGEPGSSEYPIVRILPGRVTREDPMGNKQRARTRTLAEHRDLEGSMRKATPSHPAFVYEAGDLTVYPLGGAVEAAVVTSPPRVSISDYEDGNDELTVDARFAPAMVYGVCSHAEKMLSEETASRLEFSQKYRELSDFFLAPYLLTHRFGRRSQYERGKIDTREVASE